MDKKIFVVIPYYNGREYLPDCFASLAKQTFLPEKIIVLDNHSTDGSQEELREIEQKYPSVKVVYNQNNLGFVGACNQGIELAIKAGADYVFLLNQDTICDQRCLENLLLTAEGHVDVFAVQALLLCWPRQDLIQTSGDHIHFLGFGYSGDFKQPANKYQHLEFKNITYASGAAMFFSATAIQKVGLFDQDLFMYHDDLDLCWRARLLGYQIILAPQAIVYHKYTESIVKSRWYWSERNRTLTLLKFYRWPTLLLIFPAWLVMELGTLLYSLFTGWFGLKLKSYWSALRLLPKTIIKRRAVQKNRIVFDRQIAKVIDGQLNFAGLDNPLLRYLLNPILGFYWLVVNNIVFW